MIKVRLLNNNTIITLESDGKPTIRASSGMYYHSANEFLCCALSSCFGRHLVIYFTQRKIDIALIKELEVGYDGSFIVNFKYFPEIESNIKDIENLCVNCEVVKLFTVPTRFNPVKNDEPFKQIEKKQPCCGDR
jgi:hypothetical protein